MRARVLGFTRTVEWRDEPNHTLHLSVQGTAVDLPVPESTFNKVYREYTVQAEGPNHETRTFTPPAQIEVEIEVELAR